MFDHKKLKHSLSVQDADDVLYDDDTDDYQNFSNLEYENDELESSYDINKQNKDKENIVKLNENEKATNDENKDSISNRTIFDTAKLSNLIRNDMDSEKNEIGNLDTKLLNLAELSGDKTT
ncbi:hypothetical protein BpHYR1_028118 [Brachionus plicatilis]|uniref:Uncharacterized protein n=1 Tax=Brachionus plicatilis TaxID=10195 RepID=A0A3M7SL15_BRAPC|nr:hypothetical protein BpHYR1_028118 [Brachionus plicatilis]